MRGTYSVDEFINGSGKGKTETRPRFVVASTARPYELNLIRWLPRRVTNRTSLINRHLMGASRASPFSALAAASCSGDSAQANGLPAFRDD